MWSLQKTASESRAMINGSSWLALMIGNSRLHWAAFKGDKLLSSWDSSHDLLTQESGQPKNLIPKLLQSNGILEQGSFPLHPELWFASVVPDLTPSWCQYPKAHLLTLNQVPLGGTYQSLGIDRALAVWGAGIVLGWPVLVIDAGTALTFTGADGNQQLVGGAILPGLRLQLQTLHQGTAALPPLTTWLESPPQRWAINTPEAMASGVFYTLLAGVEDFLIHWQHRFPNSVLVLTGGDRTLILRGLERRSHLLTQQIVVDPHCIFWGIRACYQAAQSCR